MKPGTPQNVPFCSACFLQTPLVLRGCHQVNIKKNLYNKCNLMKFNMTFHDVFRASEFVSKKSHGSRTRMNKSAIPCHAERVF